MRPVIEEAKTIAPGGPGTPAVDRTAPETKVKKGPKRKTTKRKVKFTFSASEASTFTCALDKAAADALHLALQEEEGQLRQAQVRR